MPTASKQDLAAGRIIESWRHTAESEIEDIGCWRDADAYTLETYWLGSTTIPPSGPAKMPGDFYTQTSYLVGEVTSNYPKLDPTPLQEIYDIVLAWHEDRSASRLPAPAVITASLDRAMMTLQAVDRCAIQRADKDETFIEKPQAIAGEFMSYVEIAKRFSISKDAMRKRLSAWRKKNFDGWTENADATGRQPKYLYLVAAVMPIIESMQAKKSV